MPAPFDSPAVSVPTPPQPPVRWVVVLCADWCGTCRGYRQVQEEVVGRFEGWRTAWIDIEDQSELVDALDVETFPTVLIYEQAAPGAGADRQFFFGPMLPHAGTLQRQMEEVAAPGARPQAQALAAGLETLADWLRRGGASS
ncbi:MAG: thioredoxin family protein [Comamonas sp.]